MMSAGSYSSCDPPARAADVVTASPRSQHSIPRSNMADWTRQDEILLQQQMLLGWHLPSSAYTCIIYWFPSIADIYRQSPTATTTGQVSSSTFNRHTV